MTANKPHFNSLLPHLICIVLFYVVTILYFKPEFFERKSLYKHDIANYEGGARETIEYNKNNQDITLWTNSMFSGMPNVVLHPVFPDQPVGTIDKIFKGIFLGGKDAHMLFLALLCFYLALLCFRVQPYLAAIGALSFGLSTYNLIIIEVGHMTKMWAIGYAPLVLGSMYLVYNSTSWKKMIFGMALFAMVLTLELRANHVQITYYLAFICLFYSISELVFSARNKLLPQFIKASGMLLFAAVLALGTGAGRLITTNEYGKYSTRGQAELTSDAAEKNTAAAKQDGLSKEYAFAWSEGIFETFTLLIPNLYGGSSNEKLDPGFKSYETFRDYAESFPMYWGDQPFTNSPVYAGAVVCFLFVLSLLILDNRYRYWMLAGVLLMFMFSWGRNFDAFNYFMFDAFPGFNKFRSVSMALSLAVMLMGMAGFMALEKLLQPSEQASGELFKKFLIAAGITGGFCLFLFLFSGMFDYATPQDQQFGEAAQLVRADRQSMLRRDALRSFGFIAVAVAAIFMLLKKRISPAVAFAAIGLFSTVDLWSVGKRYVNDADFQPDRAKTAHAKTAADEAILRDQDPHYRVYNLQNPFNDAQTSYYHKSIGGYFAAKLRRYQELNERLLEKETAKMIKDLQEGKQNFENYRILNMLNARYLKFGNTEKEVLRNPSAYGNAWFVNQLVSVNSADEEMAKLGSDALNLRTSAVVDISKFKVASASFATDTTASVRLTSYSPKELNYESDAAQDGFIVFSEIYYPEGWKATIDGKPADHLRVNYVLRGMAVPAGKHAIKFVFEPSSYQMSALVTQICSIAVSLLFLGALGFVIWGEYKNTKK